jgi:hypothetical protein
MCQVQRRESQETPASAGHNTDKVSERYNQEVRLVCTKKGISMSKVAKGKRAEKRCADELKALGYHTWKTIRHQFLNIDLWGYFDVVVLAADGSHLRFIQVKSNRPADKATREAIENLAMPSCCWKEIWVWYDYKGFQITRCNKKKEWEKAVIAPRPTPPPVVADTTSCPLHSLLP